MRKLLTGFSIMIAVMVLALFTVILFRLKTETIELIGLSCAGSIVILALGCLVLFGLVAKQKYRTIRAQADEVENKAAQNKYLTQADGYGMLHLVNVTTGHSQNLTLDARAYRNGHFEEPHPIELENLRNILASRHAGTAKAIIEQPAQLLPGPLPELMTILKDAQRVLIKAISNGGKTTLLQHIADSRIKSESVLVLDSQSYPDKWPAKCKVIGAGSNHQAISIALDNLIELMVKRYQEIGQGLVKEGQHPKLTIIIDEWMAIVDECPNAGDVVRRLLTESRKAAFSIFIGSHSERVKSLGLDGRGDLRDGFLIVRLEIENGQHKATYDYGRGERPCILPGSYISAEKDDSTLEFLELKEPDVVIDKKLSERQLKILELVKQGLSDNEIAVQVFKKSRLVGSHFYEVKEMRELFATYT